MPDENAHDSRPVRRRWSALRRRRRWNALFGTVLGVLLAVPTARAEHPDFSGTWRLDRAASTSVEAIMKTLGHSWMERRAIRWLPVKQVLVQDEHTLSVSVDNALLQREQVFPLDGTPVEVEAHDGSKVWVRCFWSEDGRTLVTVSDLPASARSAGTATFTRTLEEGGATLRQVIEISLADGTTQRAVRVFRRSE